MKSFTKGISIRLKLLTAFAVTVLSAENVQAQCSPVPASDIKAEFCKNQRGEIFITDPDPTVKYHWYRDGDMKDMFYGIDASGRHLVTSTDLAAAESYWYRKEIYSTIGPGVIAQNNGSSAPIDQDGRTYEMAFDASIDFTLNSVKVPVLVYQNTPTYGLQITVKSSTGTLLYSGWNKFKVGTSNTWQTITIPTNIAVPKGTGYTIQLTSVTDATLGITKIDNIYWYPATAYSATSYVSNAITVKPVIKNIWSSDKIPVISDWNITVKCDLQKVTINEKLTGCCTPVGNSFKLSAPKSIVNNGIVVEAGDLPFNLTVTGTDAKASHYYLWTDKSGNELPASGAGEQTLNITAEGIYKVRLAQDNTFINSYSCYKEASVMVVKKVLYAPNDTTVCAGENFNLTATGNVGSLKWSPAQYLSSATTAKTTGNITTPTVVKYYVEGTVPVGNLVVDGDFSQSTNVARKFESMYKFGTAVGGPSEAVVGKRAEATYTSGSKVCDDSAGYYTADRGNFLIADASVSTDLPAPADWGIKNFAWQQSNLPVSPNTDYQFRFVASDWGMMGIDAEKNSQIQMYVNGTPLLITPKVMNRRCKWTEVVGVWNSGNSSSATLTISEINAQHIGNEFAIDDISFGAPYTQKDSVTITAKDCSFIEAEEVADKHCIDGKSVITADHNGLFMGWTVVGGGTATILNPSKETTEVNPKTSTKYVGTAKFPMGNQIINGDFELGNQGFYSEYKYSATSVSHGQYTVGTNPKQYNYWAVQLRDHTTGSGNMYYSDGGSVVTESPYKADVNVETGMEYAFSVWVANIHNEFAKAKPDTSTGTKTTNLTFKINNKEVGGIKLPLDTLWHQYFVTWKADVTGKITIEIENNETANAGNDFAFDDIVFAQISPLVKTDTVTVLPCTFDAKDTTVTLCADIAESVDLSKYNATVTNHDLKASVLSWHSAVPAAANKMTDVSKVAVTDGKIYYAIVNHTNLGSDTAEVKFIVNALPVINFTATPDLCVGGEDVTLTATPAGGTFSGTGVTGNKFKPSAKGNFKVIYNYTHAATGCKNADTNTVHVAPVPTSSVSSNSPVCSGAELKISLTTNAGVNATFSWVGPNTNSGNLKDFTKTSALVADGGKYYVFVTDSGCVKRDSVDFVVNQTPDLSVTAPAEVCAPATVDISASKVLNISGSTIPAGISYKYFKSDKTTAESSYTAIPATGTYYIAGTASNCSDTVEVPVVVNAKPVIEITTSADDLKYCEGTLGASITAAVKTGQVSKFIWTRPDVSTALMNPLTNATTGNYSVVGESLKGCMSDPVSATVNIKPLPEDGTVEGSKTICSGATGVEYTASGASDVNDYRWTLPAGTSFSAGTDTTGLNTTAVKIDFGTASGTVNIGVTPLNACGAGTEILYPVQIDALPDKAVINEGTDKQTCLNCEELTAKDVTTGKRNWSVTPSSVTITSVPDSSSATFCELPKLPSKAVVTLTVRNGVCPVETASFTFNRLNDLTQPEAGNDQTVCSDKTASVALKALNAPVPSNGNETGSWSAVGPAAVSSADGINATVSGLVTGENKFVYTIVNDNCPPAKDTVVVKVDQLPGNVDIVTVNDTVCSDIYDVEAAIPSAGTGAFTPAGSFTAVDGQNVKFKLPATGSHKLYWEVKNGVCPVVKDSVIITRAAQPSVSKVYLDSLTAGNFTDVTGKTLTLCINHDYAIQGQALKAAEKEKGEWYIKGTTVALTDAAETSTQDLDLLAAGTGAEAGWVISKPYAGCVSDTAVVKLNVSAPPSDPGVISGEDTVCASAQNVAYSIAAVTGAKSYKWTATPAIVTITGENTKDAKVSFPSVTVQTKVTLSVKAINSCGESVNASTYDVEIYPELKPEVTIAADKNSICADSSATFTVTDVSAETTTPVFTWMLKSGSTESVKGAGDEITLGSLKNGDKVYVKMKSDYRCALPALVSSDEEIMQVVPMKTVSVDIETSMIDPVCAGTPVVFKAKPVYPGLTPVYKWTIGSAVRAGDSDDSVLTALSQTTDITVELTSNERCYDNEKAQKTITFRVNPVTPMEVQALTATDTCAGKAGVPFTAKEKGSAVFGSNPQYSWKLSGNGITRMAATRTYTPESDLPVGTYNIELIVKSSAVCPSQLTDTVSIMHTVNRNPQAAIDEVGHYFCPGTSLRLTAREDNMKYLWSGGDAGGKITKEVDVAVGGDYTVKVTDPSTGCFTVSSSYRADVFAPVTSISSDPADGRKCVGLPITLSAPFVASSIYTWTDKDGVIQYDSDGVDNRLITNGSGLFKVVVTLTLGNATCHAEETFNVVDIPKPAPVIDQSDTIICENAPLLLTAGDPDRYSGPVTWYKSPDKLLLVNSDSYLVKESGTYFVSQDNGKCKWLSEPVEVTVDRVPEVSTDPHLQAIVAGNTATLNGTNKKSDITWYSWTSVSYGKGISSPLLYDSTAPVITVAPMKPVNIFYLTALSENGACMVYDSSVVTVEIPIKPWNSLSPNGDGVYDTWNIDYLDEYPNAQIQVFNRWGNLVYESKGYSKPWNGTNFRSGEPLPVATYYYVIYPNGAAVDEPITGDVTIVK